MPEVVFPRRQTGLRGVLYFYCMAIHLENEAEKMIRVNFSNGHFEKLERITKNYDTKSVLHTIAFLLDVADESMGDGLVVNGKRCLPSDDIKQV